MKIFCYELRRAVFRWLFAAMLAANGLYAWYVLTTDIIAGVAYTAPFSVWSCCAYFGKIMPVAILTVLLTLCGYYGKKQKQVEILISAAPVTPARHLLIRSAVLAICFFVICAATAMVAAYFYSSFFQYTDFAVFLPPALLIMLPCFLFSIGLGHLLGRLHQGCVYAFLCIAFLAGLARVEHALDLFCAGYFAAYPLTLAPGQGGEPAFFVPPAWLGARVLYLLLGIALILWNVRKAKQKSTRA